MTSDEALQTAKQILQIVPLVMRVVHSTARHSGHDLVPSHFRLLGMLCHRPHTLSELAENHAVSLPTISNTVSLFEERGWVMRVRSTEDRRLVRAEITEAGRATLEDAHRDAEAAMAKYLTDLSNEDREAVTRGLEVLHRVFGAALNRHSDSYQQSSNVTPSGE
jgi:DNA-binding MarR family transcriptional regulator